MSTIPKTQPAGAPAKPISPTKNQQVIDLLSREGGETLIEMSTFASWQPHSTRSFMTRLKKKGHIIERYKIGGDSRYRILSSGSE